MVILASTPVVEAPMAEETRRQRAARQKVERLLAPLPRESPAAHYARLTGSTDKVDLPMLAHLFGVAPSTPYGWRAGQGPPLPEPDEQLATSPGWELGRLLKWGDQVGKLLWAVRNRRGVWTTTRWSEEAQKMVTVRLQDVRGVIDWSSLPDTDRCFVPVRYRRLTSPGKPRRDRG